MKALILNSGLGSRMGEYVENNPKCMVKISNEETIISRQIRMLYELGITDVVITTGRFADKIEAYCKSLKLPLNIMFVYNPDYESTNYIYSIFLAREYLQDDILLMHGDLVFEKVILKDMLISDESRVVVSSTASVPQKDFKAVIDNGVVKKIGVDFFDNAI